MAVAALTAAFSVPSQVETIGALAGLAAILGLAVLSMLYFAQARELKRLREWAGRAPERPVEVQRPVAAVPQRRVAAPVATPAAGQPARPGAAVPATPAGQAAQAKPPVPGAAAAAAAAAAGAAPAVSPSAGAPGNGQADAAKLDDTQIGAPPADGEQPTTAQPSAKPGVPTPLPVPAAARLNPPPTAAGTRPGTPAARTRSGQPLRNTPPSATLPPRGAQRDEHDAGGGHRGRSIALIIGAVVLVLAAGAFAITQLGGGGDDTPAAGGTTPAKTTTKPNSNTLEQPASTTKQAAALPPKAETTVAVLNGTTVPGLARAVADRLETAGYKIGAVTNGPDQQRAATQVAYSSGNVRIARAVAKTINVGNDSVEPIDEVTQQTAGNDALVVVTVGSDQQR